MELKVKEQILGVFFKQENKGRVCITFIDSAEILNSVYISKCKTNKALSFYVVQDENWQ